MAELDATYDPKRYEAKWYKFWNENGYFNADVDHNRKPFVILMPPPNVTAQLHMGHGTGYTIQDLLIRWKRMSGYNACWLPGTDHAGIATQMMVEQDLWAREKKTRHDLGRQAFLKLLEGWKEKYGGTIIEQMKMMGFSCDWRRLAYTMDPQLSYAVRYVFVKLFEQGLVYRSERLVNWDTVLKTAISDDEVENKEVNGFLWYFRYPIKDSQECIPIATTRPETMLGDTAVAVNPKDPRFAHLIGKEVCLPLTGRLIPIIGDDYVKSEFGTGAVKITPAHDPNDFDIGKRHQLAFINVMHEDGTMNENCPKEFQGLDRFDARKKVIIALKQLELFDKDEKYKTSLPHSERSKTIIEPRLSMQWYVKMSELAKPAADFARQDELLFYPESWRKTYLYWLDNIQDWCISRQLWWGHRIPIWYCRDCHHHQTGLDDPSQCSSCHSENLRQDEDVLDTWFSSWLWPLSPFGWPSEEQEQKVSEELDYFYPSNVLVTAPEIIFLWVARMIMAGRHFKNQAKPAFKEIYFNATVCDKQGRKFSKTLGNGIDPLEVIEAHGADAVRFTAVHLAPLGGRLRMDKADFEHGARFVNKIWNAARFLLGNCHDTTKLKSLSELNLSAHHSWLLGQLHKTTVSVNEKLEKYRINEAVIETYHFIWNDFCDWGIETAKEALAESDSPQKEEALSVLVYCLDLALRLAHPIMPFVTEEIWQKLPGHPDLERKDSLCISSFPEADKICFDTKAHTDWSKVQELISSIRALRAQGQLSPKAPASIIVRCEPDLLVTFSAQQALIQKMTHTDNLSFKGNAEVEPPALIATGQGYEAYLPAKGLIDLGAELDRIKHEIKRIEKITVGIDKKLSNENFVARAPSEVIEQNRQQLDNLNSQLRSLRLNLDSLEGA